jgi:predicted enzyme related to lactoylglutathione lyase
MQILNALASLAVADMEHTVPWYEGVFGPSRRPMAEVAEWQFDRGGGLQVYHLPERAGRGSCTVIVDDLDAMASHLRSLDLEMTQPPTRSELVDTLMIRDPEGNSIAFASPHTDRLIG